MKHKLGLVTKSDEQFDVKVEVACNIELKDDHPDERFFKFSALGSTFGNIDLDDDVMVKGVFEESLTKEMPVILWQHDRHEPIGIPESILENDTGLMVNVVMPKDDTFVSGRVMPQLRIGSIKAMSVGFRVLEWFIKDGIRFITKATLKEISLVTFPANPLAQVIAVKTVTGFQGSLPIAPRSHPWAGSAADKRVRTFAKATEAPNAAYAKNFMWHDGSAPDEFGSYKLGFVDIVGGKRTIIPRALSAIRGVMGGARGGVQGISSSERTRISSITDRYLAKLDEEQPKHMYDVTEVEKMNKRDLEVALRESGSFSKDAAVLVASSFSEESESPTDDEEATVKALETILGIKSDGSDDTALVEKLESILSKEH